MDIRKTGLLLTLAIALVAPSLAHAQIQNTAQRACIISVNKAGAKLVKTIRKTIAQCGRAVDAGGTQDILSCVLADEKGKIAAAQQKVLNADDLKCTVVPSYGYAGGAAVNASSLLEERGLAEDVFGEEVASGLAADPSGCRRAVTADYTRLGDTLLGEFNRCVTLGLKTAAIDSEADLQNCLLSSSTDERGKLASATSKLMLDFLSRCSLAELEDLLPGLCGGAAGVLDFGTCVDRLVRCRTCTLVNASNALEQSCDLFDNGVQDASCPPNMVTTTTTTTSTTTTTVPVCGDGHVQAGEECDDDNTNNQDNCTNACKVAICGDHIRCANVECTTGPNGGTEECDGLASAACPGACLETCACAGNTLPPTTTTTTTTTSTTTTTTTMPDIIQVFPTACVDVVLDVPLLGGEQQVKSFGTATVRFEMGTFGDSDNDGKHDIEAEVTNLLFTASDAGLGTITVRLRDPNGHPLIDQRTRGIIEENVNSSAGLDWTPYGNGGGASARFNAFVEAQLQGTVNTVIHHDVPIDLLGALASQPPAPGNLLVMQNATPVPVVNPFDASFFDTTINSLTFDLNATTCE